MIETTTIQVEKQIVTKLKEIKEYPRESYNELIRKLIVVYSAVKKKNSYDEFLHKIQQPKMKELWDNPEDEAWEYV